MFVASQAVTVWFQSLMGFPMHCDIVLFAFYSCIHNPQFQSLMGFPMHCDLNTVVSCFDAPWFQSLMGFPMHCDQVVFPAVIFPSHACFNPLWVFQCTATVGDNTNNKAIAQFQSLMGFPMHCDLQVWKHIAQIESEFQSLMGFPMHCDVQGPGIGTLKAIGFNPLWVFQCTATEIEVSGDSGETKVSIPYGFSNALRPPVGFPSLKNSTGFNPLWVFQCTATNHNRVNTRANDGFQSLMGFPMHCDIVLQVRI